MKLTRKGLYCYLSFYEKPKLGCFTKFIVDLISNNISGDVPDE